MYPDTGHLIGGRVPGTVYIALEGTYGHACTCTCMCVCNHICIYTLHACMHACIKCTCTMYICTYTFYCAYCTNIVDVGNTLYSTLNTAVHITMYMYVSVCRLMFWSSQGRRPRIMRSALDGTSKTAIVTKGLDDPNGIAVDYEKEIVYWVDGNADTLEMIHYNKR